LRLPYSYAFWKIAITIYSFLFMSFWGKKGRNTPTIRIEKIKASTPPPSVNKTVPQAQSKKRPASSRSYSRPAEGSLTPRSDSRDSTPAGQRRRLDSQKRSPAFQRVESDSEDDGSFVRFDHISSKKTKNTANVTADTYRQLQSLQAFSAEDGDALIHAADIACVRRKFPTAFSAPAVDVCVELQYPSSAHRERYVFVCINQI
jgi:hypothetical protein